MESIPVLRSGVLQGNAETIFGSSGTIRLEVIFLGILKTSTDISGFKPLRLAILVNLDGQYPTSRDIVVNLMSSLVTKRHSGEIQQATKLLKFGLFDFLGILARHFSGDNRFSLRLLSTILPQVQVELMQTSNII